MDNIVQTITKTISNQVTIEISTKIKIQRFGYYGLRRI